MATWRDDKILELANQLTYSPAEKRHEQLEAAIVLAGAASPARAYPWDFVHFRLTGFPPIHHSDHTVAGKTLLADLATLIEFLSDTLSIPVHPGDDADEFLAPNGTPILTMDEVSTLFKVSSKTIQRWRKIGLVALRYIYPDGRRRIAFREPDVATFASLNATQLAKSAAFKQMTDEERRAIVTLARALIEEGDTSIQLISEQIASRVNRSVETVRYTLRRHDRAHPESPLFGETGEVVRAIDRAAIVHSAREGLTVSAIAARYHRTEHAVESLLFEDRVAQVKAKPIRFITNPLFEHPDAETIILRDLPQEAVHRAQLSVAAKSNTAGNDIFMARIPHDLPAPLQEVFREPVIPHELETDIFRRMNFLKFQAAALQQSLTPATATPAALEAIESRLKIAQDLKNQLVQSNLRVAVHVSRKHQRVGRPLMELFSDAAVWLMQAADSFDFARGSGSGPSGISVGGGARFSTYASYAIVKNFARPNAHQLARRDTRHVTGQQEILDKVRSPEVSLLGEQLDQVAVGEELLDAVKTLPDRERELLSHHFGLDPAQQPLSLSEIGTKMGITKARVRQLEARALHRLRHLLEKRRDTLHAATFRKD